MVTEQKIICPICSQISYKLYSLNKDYILDELKKYYADDNISSNIISTNYDINKCTNCNLEFATPLTPGSNEFYSWITLNSSYYTSSRWEYEIVSDLINQDKNNNKKYLIDVGCGKGDFLKYIKIKSNVNLVGIDTTKTSSDYCIKSGFEVYCMDIESFSLKNNKVEFDYVTAFHILEHVKDPKKLISEMKNLIKEGGKIFISTPYSPMSIEYDCFDPLNHPPHHMTRWNVFAYKELAKQLNLNIKFFFPPTINPLIRSINSVYFKFYSRTQSSFLKKARKVAVKHSIWLIKNFIKQIKRECINKTVAGDLVLVQLSRRK